MTGDLSFLPVHAAGKNNGPTRVSTTDYAVSSYIPTLSALIRARTAWKPMLYIHLAGLPICETSPSSVDASRAGPLPCAAKEVTLVRKCFESAQVRSLNAPSEHTSVSELRSLLMGAPAHILHLACHGMQHSDPLKSAILLQDGCFTMKDLIQLELPHAVLAVLSACQTAKGDRNAPDQAVHLAASMLFCGFRSVIGTMW
jgi:CHAT domain-containing protein